ncbi:hypothetical protein [Kitasatospora sp. NPDC050543]|uniref:hypothetical protein n=1 Tax=Kitasatospora sp. NPDC050543 TaxID=3364054 RepID=UPI0037AD3106
MSTTPGGGPPWLDQAGAAERCEALLQHTLEAVRPELVWRHGVPSSGARLAAPGTPAGADLGWYVSRNRNVMTIVSPARRGALLGVVERHWRRFGCTITSVNADPVLPAIYAVTAGGFRLALDFGTAGNAYFTAASPAVARSAYLEYPPGTPGSPEHPGSVEDMAPLPYVRCPFWSAL